MKARRGGGCHIGKRFGEEGGPGRGKRCTEARQSPNGGKNEISSVLRRRLVREKLLGNRFWADQSRRPRRGSFTVVKERNGRMGDIHEVIPFS